MAYCDPGMGCVSGALAAVGEAKLAGDDVAGDDRTPGGIAQLDLRKLELRCSQQPAKRVAGR